MKKGLKVGSTETMTITVTSDMVAQFEGRVVHPAYSTVSLVYHMEWASRKLILPFLESHEEGIGAAVQVKHIAPSAVGSVITVTATVTELRDNIVISAVDVKNQQGLIGKGEVKQAILPKKVIEEKLAESI